MTCAEKLAKLRRENNYTQEQLAGVLGVSRQAVSKWESGAAYPETDKLIRISELFGCSLDYLLKDAAETKQQSALGDAAALLPKRFRERSSKRTLWGMPLWQIGRRAKGVVAVGVNARGVIAIGLWARGVISCGLLSVGLLSFGFCAIGLLSFGLLALGLACGGCFSVGVLAAGAISFGAVSLGAVAIGDFSVGALAVGKYAALGDHARAMIAIGDTQAAGTLYQKIGELTPQEAQTVRELLDTAVPAWLTFAKKIFSVFL